MTAYCVPGRRFPESAPRIAYVAGGGVYVVGLDGTVIFSIAQVAPNYVPEAAISPDGKQLAIVGHDAQRGHELIVTDIGTGNHGVVLEGTISGQSQPAWSPDGQWIAMPMAIASGSGIFIVRPDGLETRQLTRGDFFGELNWVSNDRIRFTSFRGGL